MNKKVKFLASILVGIVTLSSLVGCGSSSTASSSKGGKTITVWSHLTQAEVKQIAPIAQQWAKKTGNKVNVVCDTSEYSNFLQAGNSSKGPDVMFGVPQDNLGTFQKAGLLQEVTSSDLDKSKYPETAIKAVTLDGKQYAIPLSIETTTLFYNTDKVKTVPKTFDELVEQAKTVGFQYSVNDLYYSYPLIAAYGGYMFKDNNGSLDSSKLGIANEGAVKGFQMIQDLVQKDKFMSADIKGDIATGQFQAGKTGFYIGGPWDVDGFKKANLKFAVVPMPTIAGKPMSTFVGVQTGFVNARSKNKTEAMDLLKYLAANTSQILFKTGNRIPALTSEADKVSTDPNVKAFVDQVKVGTPMPNIQQASAIWKITDSLNMLTSGKMTPANYAQKAESDVKAAIDAQK